jgi:DNA mismatch repair ATPase MutL
LALFSNTTGIGNTAVGGGALALNTTGGSNTAIGTGALSSNTTGNGNIAVGSFAGHDLTTGNQNIVIGNPNAVADESNTIRIGGNSQTRAFFAGIRGVATGNNDAVNVVIDSDGQLGTVSSSRRFKKEIKPMDTASEAILALKPVTFHYKSDETNRSEFGLIAEEVAQVNPDLVVHDENGEIYTVRYEAVNAMLLNEFLKEHRKNQEQQATIIQLKSTDAKQEAIIAQQQKQIAALAAGLQKVSAQLEANRPAPQTVLNNQ